MARRRTAKKRAPRKFTGLNVTSTALAAYQANAVLHAATGSNLVSFFMPGAKVDGALNLTEIWQGMTSTGLFKPGSKAGGSWVGPWSGAPSVADAGLGGAVAAHLKKGLIPAAFKIVASNAGVKVARKMGLMRNLNKLTRSIGFDKVVRF